MLFFIVHVRWGAISHASASAGSAKEALETLRSQATRVSRAYSGQVYGAGTPIDGFMVALARTYGRLAEKGLIPQMRF